MSAHADRRRGAVEGALLMILAVLLLIAVIATAARRIEISRHAARLELRVELSTALESALEEAYWQIARAVPDDGKTPSLNQRREGKHMFGSRVLTALKKGDASTSSAADVVPVPMSRAIRAAGFDLDVDEPTFSVYQVKDGGRRGMVNMKVTGRATRGGSSLSITIEHRRLFISKSVKLEIDGKSVDMGSVYIIPELIDAEVTES